MAGVRGRWQRGLGGQVGVDEVSAYDKDITASGGGLDRGRKVYRTV